MHDPQAPVAAVAPEAGRPDPQWRALVAALIEGFIEDDSLRRNARAFATAWVTTQPVQALKALERPADPTGTGKGSEPSADVDEAASPVEEPTDVEDPADRRRRLEAIAHSISCTDIDAADLLGLVLELADLAKERLPVLVGMYHPQSRTDGAVWPVWREPDGVVGLDMSKGLSDAALDVWGEVLYSALLHDSHSGGYVSCSSCGEVYDVEPVFPDYTCPVCGDGAAGGQLDGPGAEPLEPGPVDHSEDPF